jgi:cyclase
MHWITYLRNTCALLLLLSCLAAPALAQFGAGAKTDLSGEWRKVTGEDVKERGGGPDPGEYWGIPLNDAARMRTDTYNGAWISTPLAQCRPHPTGYQQLGPDPMRISKEVNPITREMLGFSIIYHETPGLRMIWTDGRRGPSPYASRSWEGYSTGRWEGDTFIITTTHMKESFVRRNGMPASFRRTVTEHVSLDEPYLTWVVTVYDPDYLTEPLVRSVTYIRSVNNQVAAYPCAVVQEDYQIEELTKYNVPHYLPGENEYLTEVAVKYKMPLEGVRGGAETLYPSWHAKGKTLPIPDKEYVLKPTYSDESTRIAERAAAQPRPAPRYDEVESLHVNGNVYVLAGGGANVTLSVGGDGIVMVDSGAAAASPKILEAITRLITPPRPGPRNSASPYANPWQGTHTAEPPAIRLIINTTLHDDHVGGNENIRKSAIFQPIGEEGRDELASEVILSQENVQVRMIEAGVQGLALPTHTYLNGRYRLHRYYNGEGIEIIQLPRATTDGDSMVWFRGSNVISTGAVFNTDMYPIIDVDKGGSIQGVMDALAKISDMCYPEFMSQGGTLVIPGHGWIADFADVTYYRDMVIIIHDRIQDMINKGMNIDQIKAAKPTMDYDPLYGRQPGVTARFIESIYRSLTEEAGAR